MPTRTALVAGATGLVGREILSRLLADSEVSSVHALARRDIGLSHPKLTVHLVDFAALPALPRIDEGYLALGTTIKAAGSQAAFRKVDFDANLAVAGALRAAGCAKLGLVSAMGAHALSAVFYNRVKGELEDALVQLEFHTLAIARPSFLAGDRSSLGQPERPGERWALRWGRWLAPVVPRNYAPIRAADVAAALIEGVRAGPGRHVLLSGRMQGAAAR